MDISKIKATIRAMLNLAADEAASEGEKTNAMAHVGRLMDQYNLQEEDLDHVDHILDEVNNSELGSVHYYCGQRVPAWYGQLGIFTVGLLKTVKTSIFCAKVRSIMFYGVRADCELALEIFEETRTYIDALAVAKYGGSKRGDGYSYCLGFVWGLQQTLKAQAALTAPSGSTALVVARDQVVERKQELADKWHAGSGLERLSKGKGSFKVTGAFEVGEADGLNHKVEKNKTRKIA